MTYPLLADPLEKSWTALQTWDADRGRGALLAFRQDSGDATRRSRCATSRPARRSSCHRARRRARRHGERKQLRDGLRVAIPAKDGAKVIAVRAVP